MANDVVIVCLLKEINGKLDALISALASDDEAQEIKDLSGNLFGGERDQSQSLG